MYSFQGRRQERLDICWHFLVVTSKLIDNYLAVNYDIHIDLLTVVLSVQRSLGHRRLSVSRQHVRPVCKRRVSDVSESKAREGHGYNLRPRH